MKCWRTSWAPLRHSLAKEGIELAEGMIVVLRGTLDLYRAKGEVSFVLAEVDVTALLGRMAAQRAQLLRKLEAEGLLRAQRRAARARRSRCTSGWSPAPGPRATSDFVGQLDGLGLRLPRLVGQGGRAGSRRPRPRSPAPCKVLSRSDCDVIAMVRGGGSRADLAAFDTEIVARAVAGATKPVFTGIGHTGDETVADIVAARGLHHADRVRARRSWWPPGSGGRRTWPSRRACWPAASRPSWATPRPATRRREVV